MRTAGYFLIYFILILSSAGFSQTRFLPITADYATFRNSDDSTYLEIYIGFDQKNLSYQKKNQNLLAEYLVYAEVEKGDSVIAKKMASRFSRIDSLGQISSTHKFVNTLIFNLPAGKYQAKAIVRDMQSDHWGEFVMDVTVPAYRSDSLTMSSLQLASKIEKSTRQNEFSKNTFQVIPNPETIFGAAIPILYYYGEAYNLAYDSTREGHYEVTPLIRDLQGRDIRKFTSRQYKKPGSSVVLVGGYNIMGLPTGHYRFELILKDLDSGQETSASRDFTLLKPGQPLPPDSTGKIVFKSRRPLFQYQQFSEEQLDREFESARYIATDEEKKIYRTLDTPAKREFLAAFWKHRDSDPKTPLNEFRLDYLRRVRYADQFFGSSRKRGSLTDRGRVLLTYGRPDEIERHYMDISTKPYEIWRYNELEGGVIFIFADLTGFGDFELIHSTYSKELYQPNWQKLILRGQPGSQDFNQQR